MNTDIKQDLREVMSVILGIAPDDISEQTELGKCDAWDSIRHVTLVLAVEERFGLAVSEADFPKLNSFPKLLEAVERGVARS